MSFSSGSSVLPIAPVIPNESTPVYCSADDISRLLGFGSGYFTSTTSPSITDVNNLIFEAEDMIDDLTGHAWRLRQSRVEYHEMARLGRRQSWFLWPGYPIFLNHRMIQPFNTANGDMFEVMINYNAWQDWTGSEFYNVNWWADWPNGIIFVDYAYLGMRQFSIRVQYHYGEVDQSLNPVVPRDIKLAASYYVASQLLVGADKWKIMPQNANNIIQARDKLEFWMSQFNLITQRRNEMTPPH